MLTPPPLKVFIAYSRKDEALKEELEMHLANLKRQGKIDPWQDRAIEAGTEWDATIQQNLEAAQVILLLITPRFIASESCYDREMQRAMERHAAGTARVIPILLKPCDWQDTPFSKLQVLPKDAKPVSQWRDRDTAFVDVVKGIRAAVESLQGGQLPPHSAAIRDEPPASTTYPTTVTAYQRRIKLNQRLNQLPVPQFEQVLFALNPPAGNIPSAAAPQGSRVAALLAWVESIGPGLEVLEAVLSEILL